MTIIMRLRKILVSMVVFTFAILISPGVFAEQAPLTPGAQEAFNKGLDAVKEGDWLVAIGYFVKAQEACPYEPAILYNLGLAQAKAGHELAGIAWLQAYLAASPNVSNAAAIRVEIESLYKTTETKAQKIIQGAYDSATQLQDGYDKDNVISKIAECQAKTGSINDALSKMPQGDGWKISGMWSSYGERQLKFGNLKAAQEALSHIENETYKNIFLGAMGRFHLEQKDFNSAIELARLIQDGNSRDWLLSNIFNFLFEQNDLKNARQVAREMQEGGSSRSYAYQRVLEKGIKEGDFVPAEAALPSLDVSGKANILKFIADKYIAEKDFTKAAETAQRIEKAGARAEVLKKILVAQVEDGHIDEARQTAADIASLAGDKTLSDLLKLAQAVREAESQDISAARQTAFSISEPALQVKTLNDIHYIQECLGDKTGADETRKLMNQKWPDYQELDALEKKTSILVMENSYVTNSQLAVAEAMLGKHDIARQLAVGVYIGRKSALYGGLDTPWRDDTFSESAFVQAVTGNTKEAVKTAELAGQQRAGFMSGASWEAIGRVYLKQGDIKQAKGYVNRTKYLARRRLLYEIAQAQIKAGDLAGAEETIKLISYKKEDDGDGYVSAEDRGKLGYLAERISALLCLAQAYQAKDEKDKARLLLAEARQIPSEVDQQQYSYYMPEAFKAIAKAQEEAGDKEAAGLTMAGIPAEKQSTALERWVSKATELLKSPLVANLSEELNKVSSETSGATSDIEKIAQLALDLDNLLVELKSCERELSRGTQQ